ncbi:hypothetical protein ACROYT_G014231 [Oculina patagonica]
MVDNTTAVTTINQMGTCHSRLNNQLAHQIWLWCIDHRVWLTVTHIPGKQNTEADRESRFSRRETEWTLQKPLFNAAIKKLGVTPDVDLFASRLNFQLKPYVAYKPDPEAQAINAFHVSWKGYTFYAFPPFSILQRVLQKISEEGATGLLVVPNWPTQIWWPYLMNMLIDFPLILPRKEDTLYLPAQPQLLHPLHKRLQLLVCHLSGISSRAEEFRVALQRSSCNPGEQPCQTIHALTISGMRTTNDTVNFEITQLLKTSKPGKHQGHLELKSYPVDHRLCVVTCLKRYVELTEPVRDGHDPFWLSFTKPFKPVSRDTVSRWIRNVMEKAGIDTKIFSAHSTRAAATSAANANNVSINTIMDAAGWSRESTFRKFYDKPVQANVNFGDKLVSAHDCSNKQ